MAGEAIFISYRRDDTADVAGRIYDAFAGRFGRKRLFKDVDNLHPGADFGEYIKTVLPRCRVALVLIGPDWIAAIDEIGRRRLDDPHDWVRIEIETALESPHLDVVPVLINGARMPQGDELPYSLKPLLSRHAAIIRRDPDFHDDITRLAIALRKNVRPLKPSGFQAPIISRRTLIRIAGSVASLGAVGGVVSFSAPRWKRWFPFAQVTDAGKRLGFDQVGLQATLHASKPFSFGAFSPDASRLLCPSDDVSRLFDVSTAEVKDEWPSGDFLNFTTTTSPVVFSRDGTRLLTIGSDKSYVSIRNGITGALMHDLRGIGSIVSASFSPQGDKIVTCSDHQGDQTVRILNAETGVQTLAIQRIWGPRSATGPRTVRFSPNGASVAVDTMSGVWLIDALTGETIAQPTRPSWSFAFSPSGSKLLIGRSHFVDQPDARSFDSWTTAELIDTQDGSVAPLLPARLSSELQANSFSPDGERVVLAFDDGTVRTFSVESGTETASFRPPDGWADSAVFLGDDGVIATHGDVTRLWSSRDLSLLATLHDGFSAFPSYSADGALAYVATPSPPNWMARIWRISRSS
jgi:WD40 repeat protein